MAAARGKYHAAAADLRPQPCAVRRTVREGAKVSMKRALAGVALAAICLSAAAPVSAQCTWGGTSAVLPPVAVPLRSQGEPLRAPARVAIDAGGNLYTTDPPSGKVVVRDRFGQIVAAIDGLASPLGIAVDRSGAVYVGEKDTGSVSVFGPDWTLLRRLGQGPGEFALPNDIAVDPDPARDEVYIADSDAHLIKVYGTGGALLRSFGGKGSGAGQFDFPSAIYVSAAGEVFVGDQSNDRVQVLDRDGNFLRCFGKSGMMSFSKKFGRIHGFTGDALGRIYVVDSFQDHVKAFDALGVELAVIGTYGTGAGELRTPMGAAIDRYNRLYVASVNNGRVEVYGIDDFTDPEPVVAAVVDVHPETLNPDTRRNWLTVYIEIPGYSVEDVDPSTVALNGAAADRTSAAIADYDEDGVPDLMAKVDAELVVPGLSPGEATCVVSGMFRDGTRFEGADTVRVLAPKDDAAEKARPGRGEKP